MKKILTFVVMAILLGGFAVNANAQNVMKYKANDKNKKEVMQEVKAKGENWDKVLDEYDQAVDRCLTLYDAMQKKDSSAKASEKDFNKALSQAEALKAKINKAKNTLTRAQVKRFDTASKKLLRVYED
ncbi:MAG: hypothetical protein K6F96_02220 [Bacteroidales bacterium]|nr:hypothetical protein [Bacteroidales bacterium]